MIYKKTHFFSHRKIPHATEIKKAPLRKREFLQIARYKEPAQDNMVYSQLVILQSEAVIEKQADGFLIARLSSASFFLLDVYDLT